MKKNRWAMVNVVWYDGCEAYVSKFITMVDESMKMLHTSETRINDYLRGNGEVLKFDPLYFVDLENIIALADSKDELVAAFNRFKEMYF